MKANKINTKAICILLTLVMAVGLTLMPVNAATPKKAGMTIFMEIIGLGTGDVTIATYASSKGTVKAKVYYKKKGKWCYHSTVSVKCKTKCKGNFGTCYYGGLTISGKKLTKGVTYKVSLSGVKALKQSHNGDQLITSKTFKY